MPDELVERAKQFAAAAHQGQIRKGTDTPYFTHPECVARVLTMYGCPAAVIAAGYLHDTVEDAGITIEKIRAEFGPEVADIVAGCTEPDKDAPWEERKRHTIAALRVAPLPVRLVSAADKFCNLRDIYMDLEQIGEEVWDRFKRGREEQEWYYRSVSEALMASGNPGLPLFVRLRDAVRAVFGETWKKSTERRTGAKKPLFLIPTEGKTTEQIIAEAITVLQKYDQADRANGGKGLPAFQATGEGESESPPTDGADPGPVKPQEE